MRDESIVGTKGTASLSGTIVDRSGREVWRYDGPEVDPLVQEHADLVTAIRAGKPFNDTAPTAQSTLMAIMGRDSAYTGKAITWDEAMNSNERLGPTDYTLGPLTLKAVIPVPGVEPGPSTAP